MISAPVSSLTVLFTQKKTAFVVFSMKAVSEETVMVHFTVLHHLDSSYFPVASIVDPPLCCSCEDLVSNCVAVLGILSTTVLQSSGPCLPLCCSLRDLVLSCAAVLGTLSSTMLQLWGPCGASTAASVGRS